MALTQKDQKRGYPLPVYNYRVTVDGKSMAFSEVSGIQVEYESAAYRHGLSFLEGERIKTFPFDSFFSITLKRGVTLGADSLFFFKWLASKELKALEVHLCDELGTAVFLWKIAQAVPVKLEPPSFSADTNEVVIESLEIKARGISFVEP